MGNPDGPKHAALIALLDAAVDHTLKRELAAVERRLRGLERALWGVGALVVVDVALRFWGGS